MASEVPLPRHRAFAQIAGLWPIAAAFIGAAILELLARKVARRSIVEHLVEWNPSTWTIAVVAVLAAAIVMLIARARSAALFAALFAIGLAAQISLGARLQSDGFYYYSYLRSLAFDGDVELSNDYRLLGLGDKPHLFQLTRTGHAQSVATIGPAILWAPFFAGGHAVATYLSGQDPNVDANGISFPYRQAVCVANLFYGLVGCWFMWGLTAHFFPRPLATAAIAMIVLGSFILWYLIKEPSMSHAPSMALVAGFVWLWAATGERRTTLQWIALGALAGFMTLVRWQNALFAVVPALDAARALIGAMRRRDHAAWRATMVNGAAFTAAAVVAFIPQMLVWKAIYGSWLAVSPLGPQIRFGDPHLADILWSSRNGLFSTSPVLYFSAVGLIGLAWARPSLGVASVVAVGLMTYFNACIQDWWGSAGFGGRRFDGTLPFFGLGLAQALAFAIAWVQRFPAVALSAAGAFLIFWNLTLMSVTDAGVVRLGEATSFGDVMAAQAQVFHRWFGNPFTYPASVIFAVKNGVSPSRYDLLSTNRFFGDPMRPYGRIDIGEDDESLIGEGWHRAQRGGGGVFRWAAARADLILPLDHADDVRFSIRQRAFGFEGAPEQTLTVTVNGYPIGPIAVSKDWHVAEVFVPRRIWRAGVNRVSLNFAWERRPADVDGSRDSRPLAAAVDYVRVEVARNPG